MDQRSILLIGAGLRWSGQPHDSPVIVDSEGAAVCMQAAKLLKELDANTPTIPPVTIFITAGWARKYGVTMNRIYRECLLAHGVPSDRINADFTASTFSTRGETRKFSDAAYAFVGDGDTHFVYVVDHDFHMKRTLSLLRAELTHHDATKTYFIARPVSTGARKISARLERIKRAKDYVLYIFWRKRELRSMPR